MVQVLGGIQDEYLFSPRLDNLMSTYCGLEGLVASCTDESVAAEPNVRMLALFDHEEVRSEACNCYHAHVLVDAVMK